MLYQYKNDDGKVFNLAPHNNFTIESENIFTTIVGQNGTGKSRLLLSIIKEVLSDTELNKLKAINKPSNTIAMSISPFDRFPHPSMYHYLYSQSAKEKHSKLESKYSYLGVRDSRSINFSKAYMSKIITTLMDSLFFSPKRMNNLMAILNYIGYEQLLNLSFNFSREWELLTEYFYDDFSTREENFNKFELFFMSENTGVKVHPNFKKLFFNDDNSIIDKENIFYSLELLEKISLRCRKNIELIFSKGKVFFGEELNISNEDILLSHPR